MKNEDITAALRDPEKLARVVAELVSVAHVALRTDEAQCLFRERVTAICSEPAEAKPEPECRSRKCASNRSALSILQRHAEKLELERSLTGTDALLAAWDNGFDCGIHSCGLDENDEMPRNPYAVYTGDEAKSEPVAERPIVVDDCPTERVFIAPEPLPPVGSLVEIVELAADSTAEHEPGQQLRVIRATDDGAGVSLSVINKDMNGGAVYYARDSRGEMESWVKSVRLIEEAPSETVTQLHAANMVAALARIPESKPVLKRDCVPQDGVPTSEPPSVFGRIMTLRSDKIWELRDNGIVAYIDPTVPGESFSRRGFGWSIFEEGSRYIQYANVDTIGEAVAAIEAELRRRSDSWRWNMPGIDPTELAKLRAENEALRKERDSALAMKVENDRAWDKQLSEKTVQFTAAEQRLTLTEKERDIYRGNYLDLVDRHKETTAQRDAAAGLVDAAVSDYNREKEARKAAEQKLARWEPVVEALKQRGGIHGNTCCCALCEGVRALQESEGA